MLKINNIVYVRQTYTFLLFCIVFQQISLSRLLCSALSLLW